MPLMVTSEPRDKELPVLPKFNVRLPSVAPLPVAKRSAPVRLPLVLIIRSDEELPVSVPAPDAAKSAPAPRVRV